MDRLKFIATLGGGLLIAPPAAIAQPAGKVWRIGFVGSSDIPGTYSDAFRTGLGALGFTIGLNVSIEYRWLSDRLSPTPDVAARRGHIEDDGYVIRRPRAC